MRYTMTALALAALLLQLAALILSFRLVLRTPTNTWQCGIGGGYLRLVQAPRGTQENIDDSAKEWAPNPQKSFSLNLAPPYLFPTPEFKTGQVWYHCGLHFLDYEPAPLPPGAANAHQHQIELSPHWLTLAWITPLAIWIVRRWRQRTLKSRLLTAARRGLTTAASLSLLLAIAVSILWPLSFWRYASIRIAMPYDLVPDLNLFQPAFTYVAQTTGLDMGTWPGAFAFQARRSNNSGKPIRISYHDGPATPAVRREVATFFSRHPDRFTWHLPGMRLEIDLVPDGSRVLLFIRPWLLLPLTLILPTLWLILHRARRKHRRALDHSLCPVCSYDLRAHKPGDKCPECGTPIPLPPSSKS